MRMKGKVAIVTGAGSGVGRATAQLLAGEGTSVVCSDVVDIDGRETVAAIEAAGGIASYVHADVRISEAMDEAVAFAEREFGRLDAMIANAGTVGGTAVARPVDQLTDEQWTQILDVNLTGVFRSYRAAIPALRRAGGGALSATASTAGLAAVAGQSAYSASKGGIIALTRTLAYELVADKIRVNCVCPGGVRTNLLRDIDISSDDLAGAMPAAVGGDQHPSALIHRFGEPEEVAAAHLFLVCSESSFVNGHALVADGGSMVASIWMSIPR